MPDASVQARTWWAREGLEDRGGRLTIAGRDAEQIARDHGTPLYVYDLVAAASRRRSAGRLRAAPASGHRAARAEGTARAGASSRSSAPSARQRGHGRLLTGRGRVGARQRLDAGGDQLHRHEPVRARPRPDPRRPVCISTWTCCRSSSGWDGRAPGTPRRHPREPSDRRHGAGGGESLYAGRQADEVRHLSRAAGRGRRRSRGATASRSTPCTCTSGYVYLTDGLLDVVDEIVGRVAGDGPDPAGRRLSHRRGQHRRRSRGALTRRATSRWTWTRWAGVLARQLGPLGRRRRRPSPASSSRSSPACIWPRS